jgi:NADP-dependent 3-hydroxy acid dehydrogenase YdfG
VDRGALWVTQAALPILREQGSGHIIQVSSLGGITAFPAIGAYHASRPCGSSSARPRRRT